MREMNLIAAGEQIVRGLVHTRVRLDAAEEDLSSPQALELRDKSRAPQQLMLIFSIGTTSPGKCAPPRQPSPPALSDTAR